MPTRVLHLAGSAVSGFFGDLSRLYAQDCLAAVADPGRYQPHVAYVTPDRLWRFPADLGAAAIAAAEPMALPAALAHLADLDVDVAIPQMFCRPGMTTYRALLDAMGIPYVGNTPAVMALGADKARAKAVVGAAGVAVPAGEVLRRGERPTLAPPVVVKPVDADNSAGVTHVGDPADVDTALDAAFAHSGAVLVEDYVELGREVRCGVLERAGELVCLPLEEYAVDSVTNPIRGYADKLGRSGGGDLELRAKNTASAWIVDQDDPVTRRVWEAARTCHTALGCRDHSLFDFRVDPSAVRGSSRRASTAPSPGRA
ncbi:D-alanine--D-alanine ligase family protein [Pseudonocardia saturnea]